MNFEWIDYQTELSGMIDSWLDDTAVKMTGIDEGFDKYLQYSLEDSENFPGCREYCKIVSENGVSFAVVKYGFYQGEVTVAEIIVAPEKRGMGKGTKAICDLVQNNELLVGESIKKFTAVIFPGNAASQRAFEKAGFSFDYAHEDGDALYYSYML